MGVGSDKGFPVDHRRLSFLKGHTLAVPNVTVHSKRHSPLTLNAEIFILVSFIVFGNSVLVYKT